MKNKAVMSALLALAILPAFAEDYLENPIVVTMTSVRQESRTQDLVVDYTLANQIDQIPGVYMKVDLNGGQSVASYPVAYTLAGPSTDDAGHASDTADMDRYLWLRSVGSTGPATYTQGSTKRQVTLSEGFFAGVFPVTQAQYVRVIAKNNTNQSGGSYAPVNYVSYEDVRGSVADGVNWPGTGHDKVGANSFLHALRERTGLAFELPTEAQWEFLCRAGTDTDFNDGSNLSPTNYYIGTTLVQNTQYDVHLAELGWFGKSTTVGTGNATEAKQVGQKNPNAWGLYDCHGNVWEWCLDWNAPLTTSSVTDPEGASSGSARIFRGGSWYDPAMSSRSMQRNTYAPSLRNLNLGFRLVCAFQ